MNLNRLVAQNEIFLQPGPAQIEIPVLQPCRFVGLVSIVIKRNWRRLGRIEDSQWIAPVLQSPRSPDWDLRFLRALAGPSRSTWSTYSFLALSATSYASPDAWIRRNLDQPGPVAQVHENQPAMISPSLQPARKSHGLSDVRYSQFTAIMRLQHNSVFHSIDFQAKVLGYIKTDSNADSNYCESFAGRQGSEKQHSPRGWR